MEEDDEIEYEVFYDRLEIKETLRSQRKDVFNDIIAERRMCSRDLNELEGGPENANKFSIMDWAPKDPHESKDVSLLKKKQKTEDEAEHVEEMMRKHREKEEASKKAEDEARNARQAQRAEQDALKSEIENMLAGALTDGGGSKKRMRSSDESAASSSKRSSVRKKSKG